MVSQLYSRGHMSSCLLTKLSRSVDVVLEGLARYPVHIAVCLSGGKDATVALDVVSRVYRMAPRQIPLSAYYLQLPDEFPEVGRFIDFTEHYWDLSLTRIETPTIKQGLKIAVERDRIQAVFSGVRRDDPDGRVAVFEKTGPNWPPAMRIFPLLDWTYHDIWEYADAMNLPMCELYAKGYTSLGSRKNTKPNPMLRRAGTPEMRHARELEDDGCERAGRG
jgi:FAD synthetase